LAQQPNELLAALGIRLDDSQPVHPFSSQFRGDR